MKSDSKRNNVTFIKTFKFKYERDTLNFANNSH